MHFFYFLSLLPLISAFLPYQNPPWAETWDIWQSTLSMGINSSGFYDLERASHFGIMSYDWSNGKAQWVDVRPMDCEESMMTEAMLTKVANPSGHVFVYRNLVKALPWFSSVRTLLEDPSYSGFFLKFGANISSADTHVPVCTTQNGQTKCSDYYHDQLQTPQVPNATAPDPDGACYLECDCGSVPCGEYLFDHRNGTMLTEWLINEYVLGSTAVGSPYIDGLFIDDFWCSNIVNGTGNCTDPVQGPTEIERHNQYDMQLSDQDIEDITIGWLNNMEAVQEAILREGGYTWSLIPGQDNADAQPLLVTETNCLELLEISCRPDNPYVDAPLLAGLSYNSTLNVFPTASQQVAAFQLMRGPYAWIGFGEWGVTWTQDAPFVDEIWNADYGYPIDKYCQRSSDDTDVFIRRYSNVTIQLDCDNFEAKYTPN